MANVLTLDSGTPITHSRRLAGSLLGLVVLFCWNCAARAQEPEKSKPVTPDTADVDIRELPRTEVWKPGDPVRDMPDLLGAGGLGPNSANFHYIDLGSGFATLAEFSCGAILVNAGGDSEAAAAALLDYLQAVFAARPDLDNTLESVIITGDDAGSAGSLESVVATFAVKNYVEVRHRGWNEQSGRSLERVRAYLSADERATRTAYLNAADLGEPPGLTSPLIDPLGCAGTDPVIRVWAREAATRDEPTDIGIAAGQQGLVAIKIEFGSLSLSLPGHAPSEPVTPAEAHGGTSSDAARAVVMRATADGELRLLRR